MAEFTTVAAPHPALLEDVELLKTCRIEFGRTSGPGGQHRNKVETACTLTHEATGVSARGTERRSQAENRRVALKRLKLKLAIRVRTNADGRSHRPTVLWESRRQGRTMSVNPKHRDYAPLLAEALDVIHARGFDVAGAAGVLGVSMSQLAKLVRHERHAFAKLNEGRAARGLPPLK